MGNRMIYLPRDLDLWLSGYDGNISALMQELLRDYIAKISVRTSEDIDKKMQEAMDEFQELEKKRKELEEQEKEYAKRREEYKAQRANLDQERRGKAQDKFKYAKEYEEFLKTHEWKDWPFERWNQARLEGKLDEQ